MLFRRQGSFQERVGSGLAGCRQPPEQRQIDRRRIPRQLVEEIAQLQDGRAVGGVLAQLLQGRLGSDVARPELAQEDELELECLVAGQIHAVLEYS